MSIGIGFESVLEAAKIGAEWAWSTLYGEIAGPVTGFFRSRGVMEPESATGDVFFELSRNLHAFEGTEDSFRTLVFTIAYQRLLIEGRHPRQSPRSALADRVLDKLRSDIVVAIEDTDHAIPPDVKMAFEELQPEQRDVLSLRVVAGLSMEQTAKVIGITIDTVKSAQRTGLAAIRRTLPPPVVAT
ncbi:MAG: sigma-70 family RNA polymerase sigma factor [Acidimicrobiia bacterium]|jgi:RNA polymerase sigma-70 factor (ECF subfamily)